jgi:hypothetical protein
VAEVQKLGWESAKLVVDQFADLFNRFAGGDGRSTNGFAGPPVRRERPVPATPDGGAVGGGAQADGPGGISLRPASASVARLQAELERAFDSYVDVMRRLNEALAPMLERLQGSADDGHLELPATPAGRRASARLWLHNTTSSTATALRPWTAGLFRHTGESLPGERVSFTPSVVDQLGPGERQSILLIADVPPRLPLGRYHGQVFVEHLPSESMHVSLWVIA